VGQWRKKNKRTEKGDQQRGSRKAVRLCPVQAQRIASSPSPKSKLSRTADRDLEKKSVFPFCGLIDAGSLFRFKLLLQRWNEDNYPQNFKNILQTWTN
jgi:hypothetical protein